MHGRELKGEDLARLFEEFANFRGMSLASLTTKGATMEPKHKHDCEDCILLGVDGVHDFYFCKNCDGGTLISRYGSGGPDYRSMPVELIKAQATMFHGRELGVALQLALLRLALLRGVI